MKNKINIFDAFVLVFIILLIGLACWAWKYQPTQPSTKVTLTFKTQTPDAAVIEKTAQAQNEVYFNNRNDLVKVLNVTPNGNSLTIVLEAPGSVAENKDIFNGQRVLVGQKAEIHGNYFAQGLITEIKNED